MSIADCRRHSRPEMVVWIRFLRITCRQSASLPPFISFLFDFYFLLRFPATFTARDCGDRVRDFSDQRKHNNRNNNVSYTVVEGKEQWRKIPVTSIHLRVVTRAKLANVSIASPGRYTYHRARKQNVSGKARFQHQHQPCFKSKSATTCRDQRRPTTRHDTRTKHTRADCPVYRTKT